MQFYHDSSAAVPTSFELTETFDTTSGALQGDTLSNQLFILLVDYILRQSLVDEDELTLKPANGRRHPAVILTALAYADDVAITNDSASGDDRTIRRHQFHPEAVGLKLNASKTIVHHDRKSDPVHISTFDGAAMDNYLGLPTFPPL